jgi:hypothetical protein
MDKWGLFSNKLNGMASINRGNYNINNVEVRKWGVFILLALVISQTLALLDCPLNSQNIRTGSRNILWSFVNKQSCETK